MKIQAITGVESVNQNFNNTKLNFQGNVLKTSADIIEISTPAAEKGISNFFAKAKNFANKLLGKGQLEPTESPIIAEMARKSFYSTAWEKLNDIKLDKQDNGEYLGYVEQNIKSFEKLEEVIKKALKPSDVDYNGHISQYKIDDLYKTAKAAKRIPEYSYPPSFCGDTQDALSNAIHSHEYGISLGSGDISKSDIVSDIKAEELGEQISSLTAESKSAALEESLLEGTDLESLTSNLHEHLSGNLHEGFDASSLVDSAKEHIVDLGETIAEFAKGLLGHS